MSARLGRALRFAQRSDRIRHNSDNVMQDRLVEGIVRKAEVHSIHFRQLDAPVLDLGRRSAQHGGSEIHGHALRVAREELEVRPRPAPHEQHRIQGADVQERDGAAAAPPQESGQRIVNRRPDSVSTAEASICRHENNPPETQESAVTIGG